MVRLGPGTLIMGQGTTDPAAHPAHRVALRGFALGQYPVTVAEWKACAAQGGCGALPRMAIAEDATPLHNVSWDDAQQYLAWLSRVAGRTYRLPSEAEWEYAARAGTQTRYWWGDQLGLAQANCADCGGSQDARGPMPVDRFQPNAFGLYGMLGGVAQWVQDCWCQATWVHRWTARRESNAAACAACCEVAHSDRVAMKYFLWPATSTTARCATPRTASGSRATWTDAWTIAAASPPPSAAGRGAR